MPSNLFPITAPYRTFTIQSKLMKPLYCLISLVVLLSACKKSTTEYPKLIQPLVKTYETPKGVFRVDGNKLLDSAGNPFVMRGMNFPVFWFPTDYLPSLAAASSLGCNTARLVWNNPLKHQTSPTLAVLDTAIHNCIKLKMIPIVEIHNISDITSTVEIDSSVSLLTSKNFKMLIDKYKSYVILNIANEWGSNNEIWRDTYKSAVIKLRAAGYKLPLMIDAPSWGQNSAAIVQYGLEILNTDTCKNIIFSTHAYGTWDYSLTQYGTYEARIDKILNKGLCLVFGEYGSLYSTECTGSNDAPVDAARLMKACQDRNMGYLAWSWFGNDDKNLCYDICKSWSDTTKLTPFGKLWAYDVNGVKNTGKPASVFK